MECRFHHIALKVKNFDAVVNFYKEVLGLKEKVSWVMNDNPAVMLEMADGGIVEVFGGNTDEPEANARWGHLAVLVDDVPGTYEKALALGAKPQTPPTDAAIEGTSTMNIQIAFVVGLGGEVIEFFKVK